MTGVSSGVRDERTVVVEHANYRLACGFVLFALLLDVIYRSLVRQEARWDLLAIVIVGGVGCIMFEWKKTLTSRTFELLSVLLMVVGVVAALIAIAPSGILSLTETVSPSDQWTRFSAYPRPAWRFPSPLHIGGFLILGVHLAGSPTE
jgi:hypothetical protein